MKTIINKLNIEKFLIIFLILQPIVDLITSLSVRFYGNFATIGVLVKGLFLFILALFVFLKYKFKDRKPSTIFLILFFIYFICYIFINICFKGNIVLLSELKNLIKAFFIPIIMILLYDIFKNEKINIKSRHLTYIILEYVGLIILANITGTAFDTYQDAKTGMMGWFYAGNDIGAILISLFPILYFYSIKQSKLILYIIVFLATYNVFNIGTKVPVLGVTLIIILFMVLAIFNYIFKPNKIKLNKNLILTTLLLVFIISLIPNSSFYNNLKIQYDSLIDNQTNVTDKHNSDKEILDQMIFSGRTQYKIEAQKRYNKSNIYIKLFGMGYVDENNDAYKLVERDYYDLFFNHGIIGTVLYSLVFIYLIYLTSKLIIKNKFKEVFRMNIESYIVSIVILIAIALYSGHVLLNPTVGIYFAIIFVSVYFRVYNLYYPIKHKQNKKITFMALHLKPGGVEKFISTTSKFLSKDYDVEIVCVYEYDKSKTIDIDKNVSVKYLLPKKYVPNKEKLKMSIKNKKIFTVLKEGFLAFRIIILKKIKMIQYIKNCDSSIIISTRIEHNYILSEFSNKKVLRIATEHNYYNPSYSKKVINSCSEVDYFVVSTKDQRQYYEKLFLGTSVKVVDIPFALEKIPSKSSQLNNYNLISVGRLSKEKGYSDMLEIFSELIKKDSRFKLKIIGYGQEKSNLLDKIEKLGIQNNIELCGQKNSEEIKKELLNSSLFLMTSHIESFGIVLIEAMSCGVPCIIFDDAKGACEIIKDDYNGYIIKNRNNDEYVEKILYIFKNTYKLIELGKNSKKYSNNFKINNIKSQWLKILDS